MTGMSQGQRHFGQQIEVRCWDSVDARTASQTPLRSAGATGTGDRAEVPGVVSVTYNIAAKPPSTIEAV